MNFYNEIDPYAADWLQNLITAGQIGEGKVERKSIRDIKPGELEGHTQCHFFAGIGGWPLALRLAGWPATESVWTGSCPCQSFSAAGEQAGLADDRNLWPPWFDKIRIGRPDTIFGEQVGNAIGFGWLDGISADLEREGYTVGACLLGAHSVGAPHIRQRLYWVAYTKDSNGRSGISEEKTGIRALGQRGGGSTGGSLAGWVGESFQSRLEGQPRNGNGRNKSRRDDTIEGGSAAQTSAHGGLADTSSERRQQESRSASSDERADGRQSDRDYQSAGDEQDGREDFWSRYDLVPCGDGKARRVISSAQLLAAGLSPSLAVLCPSGTFPQRTQILRGIGNAIVPQVAAEFIKAFMEVRDARTA